MKISILLVLLCLASNLHLGAVTLGQMQTFDGPESGWVIGVGPFVGTPTDVPIEPSGGPAGAGDPFMLIESTGTSGPQSRLSAQNFDLWSGDYIAAGVNQVRMDVRNFGESDIYLRLLFVDFEMMDPVNAAFTSDAVIVPALSDWQTVALGIGPQALTPRLGSAGGALSNADEVRIFHSVLPFFAPGANPPFAGTLGVDNITAAFIPEPATWTLLAGGLLLTGFARRRIRQRR